MDGDFNKTGKTYYGLVLGSKQPSSYDILTPEATEFLAGLHKKISQQWRDEHDPEKPSMKNLYGCLQRLKSFLFISKQLAQCIHHLYENPLPPPGVMEFWAIDEVSIYFESLLFHGRAALDRLTAYVAPIHKQRNCDKFSKLHNVLTNAAKTEVYAQQALDIIDVTLPIFQEILLDTVITKSLRSALIHRCSIGEITVTSLTINRLRDGSVFLFDQEIQYGSKNPAFPIIRSAWLLGQYIPFVVLNILAIYLGEDKRLALERCVPLWQNRCIAFSQFIEPSGSGIRFSVFKVVSPGNFKLITKPLSAEVLKFGYDAPVEGNSIDN